MPLTSASRTMPVRAVVLRVKPLGEKDRILHLLCAEQGKIRAVARGARGGRSRLAPLTQQFMLGRFLLAAGRSMPIVTQGEVEEAFTALTGRPLLTAWACYCCELADALPEHMPDGEVFASLVLALGSFNHSVEDAARAGLTGLWFESRYLTLSGFAPIIGQCARCQVNIRVPRENAAAPIYFAPALGGTLCGACGRQEQAGCRSAGALRLLHRLGLATHPPAINTEDLPLEEVLHCLRQARQAHLDIKLRSQAFLDEMLGAGL